MLFKGYINRAGGLEQCRITCFAALQALHRLLRQLSEGDRLPETEAGASLTEACLICRKGFANRASWAMHASKKHGYRIAASILAGESTLCAGCGKQFSRPARLRRRIGWGAFQPAAGSVASPPNDAEPPAQVAGTVPEGPVGLDPASYSRGLLRALQDLEEVTAESVWEAVGLIS